MYHLQTRNTGAPAFQEDMLSKMPDRVRSKSGEEETPEGKAEMERGQQDQTGVNQRDSDGIQQLHQDERLWLAMP